MQGHAPVFLFAEPGLSDTRLLRVELRRRGAEIRTARSIAEALREGATSPPDLVVFDAGLADAAHSDAVDAFQAAWPLAEFISLHAQSSGTPQGLGLGLLYSGAKPIAHDSMLEIILAAFGDRLKAPAPRPGAGKILCVDDDPHYLNALSRVLKRRGYQVSLCESAEGALREIPDLRPDLALIDVRMPGMDGLALAKEISALYPGRLPVVLLTAVESEELSTEGRRSGARYTVPKPSGTEKVLDVVDYLVGNLDEPEHALLAKEMILI